MASLPDSKPVGDDVPKLDDTVAVGEDLEFQRSWWRFEKGVWIVFIVLLIADLAGLLGRGPLANAKAHTPGGELQVKYERVQRENTASILTILPSAAALHDHQFHLYVSDSIVKQLGAQRIIPQPESSTLGNGGVTYVFPVTAVPLTVQIELKPSFVGPHRFTVGVAGQAAVERSTLVLP